MQIILGILVTCEIGAAVKAELGKFKGDQEKMMLLDLRSGLFWRYS
jgi:hypothetical protein